MLDRRDAGQEGYMTGGMQDRWDAGKGGMQYRMDAGKERGRTRGIQDKKDAVKYAKQEGFRTGERPESRESG